MSEFIYYLSISVIILLPALGVGFAQGVIGKASIKTIDEQPLADAALKRVAIISLTLTETSNLFALITSLILIFDIGKFQTYSGLGCLGIVCSVAIPGFLASFFSMKPGIAALKSVARQPFAAGKIMQLLLITQAIMQTPVIFGFVVGMLIRGQIFSAQNFIDGVRLFSSGLVVALGCIGPLIGLRKLAESAIEVLGTNREIYPKLRIFTFVSQALIEAQVIFVLLVSIVLLFLDVTGKSYLAGIVFVALSLALGSSTFSAGLSSGNVASKTARIIGRLPGHYSVFSRICLITQTFIDTAVVYVTITALILLLLK